MRAIENCYLLVKLTVVRSEARLQRETTFRVGGILTILLGAGFAYALFESGAGLEFLDAWLACGICIAFGAFCIYVAHDEARTRREFLRSAQPAEGPPRH
ncbi:MAG TPA: hypothetical protein VEK13_01395 [Thermoplasmata archaeon]|nr:hypothetical protein [Thermoplasmata archaeon]